MDETPSATRARAAYALSDDAGLEVAPAVDVAPAERFQPLPDLERVRPGFILLAGETGRTPLIRLGPDTTVSMEYAAAVRTISDDGLTVTLAIEHSGRSEEILTAPVTNQGKGVREFRASLGHLAGVDARLSITVGAGPLQDSSSDWLALLSFVVAPAEQVSLQRARAFRRTRYENEMAHFASVYDNALYDERDRRARGEGIAAPAILPAHRSKKQPEPFGLLPGPNEGEHVHHFGSRLLATMIRTPAPDFAARLQALYTGEPIRIASLCAGTAQIEAALIREAGVPVDLTVVDISDALLDRARSYMPHDVSLRALIQDVNKIELEPDGYDVVMCVSAIHHAVELERIFSMARRALGHSGELWLIGEQVGPTGNRLAPSDYEAANAEFHIIPPQLRRNARTGRIDADLPNTDLSEATFEGIRSDEIETVVGPFFAPIHVYKRNCFLWRMVGLDYAQNYDLANPHHVTDVHRLARADFAHQASGGWATELHGAYRPFD
jgi:SAM-dependent methyltransferase